MREVFMPEEPPRDLGEEFDSVLFELCRKDDYRGLYLEFVERYAIGARTTRLPL